MILAQAMSRGKKTPDTPGHNPGYPTKRPQRSSFRVPGVMSWGIWGLLVGYLESGPGVHGVLPLGTWDMSWSTWGLCPGVPWATSRGTAGLVLGYLGSCPGVSGVMSWDTCHPALGYLGQVVGYLGSCLGVPRVMSGEPPVTCWDTQGHIRGSLRSCPAVPGVRPCNSTSNDADISLRYVCCVLRYICWV